MQTYGGSRDEWTVQIRIEVTDDIQMVFNSDTAAPGSSIHRIQKVWATQKEHRFINHSRPYSDSEPYYPYPDVECTQCGCISIKIFHVFLCGFQTGL